MFNSDNFPKLTFGKAGLLQKLAYSVTHWTEHAKCRTNLYTKRKVVVDCVRSSNQLSRLVLTSSCSEVKLGFQIGVNCSTKYSCLITRVLWTEWVLKIIYCVYQSKLIHYRISFLSPSPRSTKAKKIKWSSWPKGKPDTKAATTYRLCAHLYIPYENVQGTRSFLSG